MYGEYSENGASVGKLLFALCAMGVPLRIVSDLTFHGSRETPMITFAGLAFADYTWTEDSWPIMTFHEDFKRYQEQCTRYLTNRTI